MVSGQLRRSFGYTHALIGHVDVAGEHAAWMEAHVPQMPYTVQLSALARLRGIEAMQFDGPTHLSPQRAVRDGG
jgi:hypothetical protein